MKDDAIKISDLSRISNPNGDVMHALKSSEKGYNGFGEAYFSIILNNSVKAWKLHKRMTMDLVVPYGLVRFVFKKDKSNIFSQEIIGENQYKRLTIFPGIWFGFQGLKDKESLVLNIADIEHDPSEVETKPIDYFNFNWSNK